jgi:Ion channel
MAGACVPKHDKAEFIMLIQLILATVMVIATVLIHGAGITGLARGLRIESGIAEEPHHFSLKRALFILIVVLALFTLHGIEIWLYAAIYLVIGAVHTLEAAVYFSTITYASIGFGDSEMARSWRLVGAIEGINGVLLLGWSTAFFVTVVARLRK